VAVSLDPAVRDGLLIGALAVALIALVLAAVALVRLRALRRDTALLAAGDDGESFVSAVARKTEQVTALRAEVDDLSALLARTRTELSDAIRHVSVVRYDAFGDMGGLLDDGGDGLVLTSIHGRAETRSYIKGVKAGASEATLSPEEQQAVTFALRGAAS
jgi:hypothetical protein